MTDAPASLHVNTESYWRGGEQQVLHLLQGLKALNHRAELVVRRQSPLAARAAAAGVAVHHLPLRGEWDLVSAFRLARLVKNGGFNILHLHTSHAHGIGRLAAMLGANAKVVAARRVVFPVSGRLARWFKYRRGVDAFIAISEAVKARLIEAGVPDEKVAVAYSGVDPARFSNMTPAAIRTEFQLPEKAILFGVVGHLTRTKGQQDFLEAAAIVAAEQPLARFILVGSGETRAELVEEAKRLGLTDRVVLAGFRNDVPAVLGALDVFVMPSHAEGLCTSVIEAMFAGLPVIGTDAGGIAEVIEDGATGIIVPPKNPPALAKAMAELLADAGKRREMGERGRERAAAKFGIEQMINATVSVYEELLRQP